jgi:hypothetical protein
VVKRNPGHPQSNVSTDSQLEAPMGSVWAAPCPHAGQASAGLAADTAGIDTTDGAPTASWRIDRVALTDPTC